MPAPVPRIRAGRLRNKVQIQKRIDTVDAAGGVGAAWVTIGWEWVDATPQIGLRPGERELITAGALRSAVLYLVVMRFRDDINDKCRLILQGPPDLPLDILTVVDPDSRRRQLTLMCQQGLTSG